VARGRERGDAGGFATVRALADLHVVEVGADVVKVEPPHGDPLRWWGRFPGDRVEPHASGLFRALSTSKCNMHVSLSESTGADTFLELVRGADLVVESRGPGTLERLGLGPSELSAANDSLVVVRISVAGQHGPYRDRPLSDLTLPAIAACDLREQVVVDDIVELGRPFRVPVAPVGEGRAVSSYSRPTSRSSFVAEPEAGCPLPGPPWRPSRTPAAPPTPAPHVGGHTHPS